MAVFMISCQKLLGWPIDKISPLNRLKSENYGVLAIELKESFVECKGVFAYPG